MRKRTTIWLPLLLAASLLLAGCGDRGTPSTGGTNASSNGATSPSADPVIDSADLFTDRDKEIGYDDSSAAHIQLNGGAAQCDSNAVQIADSTETGTTVTITDEGTYILSGTLDNGMVRVAAEDTDKIQLVLDGAVIHSTNSAALYIAQADKVFVTTADGSENTLSNGGSYTVLDDNNIDGVIFSKADLTLNGAGTLTIRAQAGHGVVSKDDLAVTSGTYDITAASHGLSGKDSVRIAAGTFTIVSGKDGIQAENNDDASLGFLYISDGSFTITAQGDGLSAGANAQIEGGTFTLNTGGGSGNVASQNSNFGSFWGGTDTSSEDSASAKGIKAAGDLLLNGGTFRIDAADDALHSNANLTVAGGDYQISTGDDGLHADNGLTVTAGTLVITQSYEGLEGHTVDISGGEIRLTSSDDGLNAAGGNDQSGFEGPGGGRWGMDAFDSDADAYIRISGGLLYIDASGDGIDSNGSLTVSGGTIYLSGPSDGGNGALDYGTQATISGGIFVAAGSSQMAQNFGSSSTQGAMMVSVGSQEAGSTIRLTDENGTELVSWEADKTFSSVIVSCPEIVQASTYTLTAGTYQGEITMNSLVYSSGGMGGNMGGMGGGPAGGGPAGGDPAGGPGGMGGMR